MQNEKDIFSLAADSTNTLTSRMAGDTRSALGLCGDGVKNVDTANSATLYKGTQSADDCFYFRKFRHGRSAGSGTGLESERVLSRFRFGGIAEWRKNGFAFVPIRKLIRIVAAAELARLSGRNEEN